MHSANDVVGVSLNSPELLEGSARLGAAAIATLAGPLEEGISGQFRRGDGDANGELDVTDAVFLLGYLFLDGTAPACLDAADANDDGHADISDAIRVLVWLFAAGGPLPEPSGACGKDLTEDDLNCLVFPPCREGAG